MVDVSFSWFRDFEIVQMIKLNFFALDRELPWACWQVIHNVRDAKFNAEQRNFGITAKAFCFTAFSLVCEEIASRDFVRL